MRLLSCIATAAALALATPALADELPAFCTDPGHLTYHEMRGPCAQLAILENMVSMFAEKTADATAIATASGLALEAADAAQRRDPFMAFHLLARAETTLRMVKKWPEPQTDQTVATDKP